MTGAVSHSFSRQILPSPCGVVLSESRVNDNRQQRSCLSDDSSNAHAWAHVPRHPAATNCLLDRVAVGESGGNSAQVVIHDVHQRFSTWFGVSRGPVVPRRNYALQDLVAR